MSELDKVIDALMKAKKDRIKENVTEEETEELINALREKTKEKIIQEIKDKYKEEVVEAANLEIEKKKQKKKLDELRSLMWNGFIVAFVVGLAVNQVTDVIGYYKGNVKLDVIWPTNIIIMILVLVCVILYGYSFLKNVIEIYNENRK